MVDLVTLSHHAKEEFEHLGEVVHQVEVEANNYKCNNNAKNSQVTQNIHLFVTQDELPKPKYTEYHDYQLKHFADDE